MTEQFPEVIDPHKHQGFLTKDIVEMQIPIAERQGKADHQRSQREDEEPGQIWPDKREADQKATALALMPGPACYL